MNTSCKIERDSSPHWSFEQNAHGLIRQGSKLVMDIGCYSSLAILSNDERGNGWPTTAVILIRIPKGFIELCRASRSRSRKSQQL
jgi:hypothetical protein